MSDCSGRPLSALYQSLAAGSQLWPAAGGFAVESVTIEGEPVGVGEEVVDRRPFCRLLRFAPAVSRQVPRVLLVAPLSGHRALLVRDMIVDLLPEHDVYVTDWIDAREVPSGERAFGLDENVDYLRRYFELLGPELHVVALCQSAVPAIAAISLIAAAQSPAAPRSLTLIAGIVDPSVRPTRVARLLRERPLEWFERHAIAAVPAPFPGLGRCVYPGFVQLAALMLYLSRHMAFGLELSRKVASDDGADARRFPFMRLYTAVMDLPAEIFLDVIDAMFQRCLLPRGRLTWRGEPVDPAAVRETAVMTVAGENDDVAGSAQISVAHALLAGVDRARHMHYLLPGGGHFDSFHGAMWRREVLPRLRRFVRENDASARR